MIKTLKNLGIATILLSSINSFGAQSINKSNPVNMFNKEVQKIEAGSITFMDGLTMEAAIFKNNENPGENACGPFMAYFLGLMDKSGKPKSDNNLSSHAKKVQTQNNDNIYINCQRFIKNNKLNEKAINNMNKQASSSIGNSELGSKLNKYFGALSSSIDSFEKTLPPKFVTPQTDYSTNYDKFISKFGMILAFTPYYSNK